jgi:hypothetical protein
MSPPFDYRDFDSVELGVDPTNCRFAEVSVETCKTCGATWLRYLIEQEAFPESGRWYRGLVTPEVVRSLTPEQAPVVLASLPWYFSGGSFFRTTGCRGSGPIWDEL